MKAGAANIRELYFEYQYLTRINGKLVFTALNNTVLQLKANTVSVPCTLDSGTYAYIIIIMSPVTYATITLMNPFIVPAPLKPLNVASNTTQY